MSRGGRRLCLLACTAALLGGCRAKLAVPEAVEITCVADADCPRPRLCRAQRCVVPADTAPAVVLEPLARSPQSPVLVRFALFDADLDATAVRFEIFDGAWRPGTIATVRTQAGETIGNLAANEVRNLPASAAGNGYVLLWDLAADLAGAHADVRIRLTPFNALSGASAESNPFAAGNEPPFVVTPIPRPLGDQGNIVVSYTLADSSSDAAAIEDGAVGGPSVEFTSDGGVSWLPATIAVGSLTDLATSPTGVTHAFTWSSAAEGNLPAQSSTVRLRIIPADTELQPVPAETLDFAVDNGNQPTLNWVKTLDDDSDGWVDYLALSFNRNVSDATYNGGAMPSASAFTLAADPLARRPLSVGDVADDSLVFLALAPPFADSAQSGIFSAEPGLFVGTSPTNPSAAISNVRVLDSAPPAPLSARTRDDDDDGRIDAVDIDFSEPLLASSVSNAGWSVQGYDPVTVTLASSTRVRVALTQPGSFDSGARPEVTYAQVLGTLTDAATAPSTPNAVLGFSLVPDDGAGPHLVRAAAEDANGDGRLDSILCTYSEELAAASLQGDEHVVSGLGQGSSSGERVVDGATLAIDLAGTGIDTAASGVAVSVAAGVLSDVFGNGNSQATDVAVIDSAPPVLVAAFAEDVNADGRLDRVRATYSEPVSPVAGSGHSLTGLPLGASVAGESQLGPQEIAVQISGAPLGTTVGDLVVAVTPGALVDGAGRVNFATSRVVRDAAGPVALFARGEDSNFDGRLDRVLVQYSEDIAEGTLVDGSHLVSGLVSPASQGGQTEVAPGQVSIVVVGADVGTTTAGLNVAIAAAAVADASGNLGPAQSLAVDDAAAPVLVSATAEDTDGDGTVDAVRCTYSEALVGFDGDAHQLVGLAAPATEGAESQSGNVIHIAILGATPSTAPAGLDVSLAANELRDAAGNISPSVKLAVGDGAGPALLSATAYDSNGDGRLDEVRCLYSEPFLAASFDGAVHTLVDIPAGGMQGAEILSGTDEILIPIEGAGVGTGVGVMSVSAALGELYDAAGNPSPALVLAPVGDGAAPRLLSHRTGDSDGNGRIDTVEVLFSEPIVVQDGNASDGLSGYTLTLPDYTIAADDYSIPPWHAAGTALLTLALSESSGFDTGVTPRLDALLGGSITDAAGNPQAAGDFLAGTASTDGAGPVIVRARYDAGDSPTSDDDVLRLDFSEPLDDATFVGGSPAAYLVLTGGAFGSAATLTTGALVNDAALEVQMGAAALAPEAGLDNISIDAASALRDLHGASPSASNQAVLIEDAGVPEVQEVRTLDDDGNGRIDHLVVTWSQAVDDSTYNPNAVVSGAFALVGGSNPLSDAGGLDPPTVGDVADDNVIYIKVLEGGAVDTGSTGSFSTEVGLLLANGDLDPSAAAQNVSVLDGAPPVVAAARTVDADVDGHIDAISVTLSEDVSSAFAVGDFAVAGYVVTGVTEDAGVVRVSLQPGASLDTGARPLVSFVSPALAPVDAAGWPLASFSRTPTDGVAPRLVTAVVRDTEPDGSVDACDLELSEPISDASFSAPSGFTLGGVSLDVLDTLAVVDDRRVRLRLGPLVPELAGTLVRDLLYSQSSAASPVVDLAGNPLGDIGSADVLEEDGAGPVPIGVARYRDVDQNGPDAGDIIEVSFGEPLLWGGSVTPAEIALPRSGDNLGSGAYVQAGSTAVVVNVVLGNAPVLGRLRFAFPGAAGSSAINFTGAAVGVLTDAAGADAQPAPLALDIVPGFTDPQQVELAAARAVLWVDLDNNGTLDLVTAIGDPLPSTVRKNNGSGVFAITPVSLSVSEARAVAAADFDWDGDVDLVFATAAGLDNVVFWNDGSGSFPTSTALGNADAYGVAVGDLQNDGQIDIVLAVAGSGADEVWQNTGGQTFGPATTLADAGDGRDVLLADIDRDGDLDIAVANTNGTAQLWHNDGAGGFMAPAVPLVELGGGSAVVAGDVDGDGDDDVLFGDATGLHLLLNQGGLQAGVVGALEGAPVLPMPAAVEHLALADFDADGDLDVLSCGNWGVAILLNQGDGSFHDGGLRVGSWAFGVATGDIDADGDLDLGIAGAAGSSVARGSLAGALGSLAFVSGPLAVSPATVTAGRSYALGDLDGDGDVDLALASQGAGTANSVLLWNGSDFVSADVQTDNLGSGDSRAVVLADFDNDGDLDAAVGDTAPNAADLLWLNDGSGKFAAAAAGPFGSTSTKAYAVGDLWRDGTIDLLIGHASNLVGEGDLLLANDDPVRLTFSLAQSFGSQNGNTLGVAIADMNRDGQLDLVIAKAGSEPDDEVWLYKTGSFGQSGLPTSTFSSSASNCLALADLDGDGDDDALVGRASGFDVFLNNGSGTLFAAGNYGSSDGVVFGIATADFDKDGDVDLAVASTSGSFVGVWLNNGSAGFGKLAGVPALSGGSNAVAVADLDRDGDVDVVIDDGTLGVRVLYNALP